VKGGRKLNRITKFLLQKGTVVGQGSGRIAIEYNDRIYKLPYNPSGLIQTHIEREIYNYYSSIFPSVFPEIEWLDNRIVVMEKITIDGYSELLDEDPERLKEIIAFTEQAFESHGLIPVEVLEVSNNWGYDKNNQIKLIDWGYTTVVHNLSAGLFETNGLLSFISKEGRSANLTSRKGIQ
jgi:hypothetical protein